MAPLSVEKCKTLMLAADAPGRDKHGRSKSLRICSCRRPWFRAFHFSWMSFFLSFLGWFAFAPVLNSLTEDPAIMATPSEIATSNIISVLGTILVRLILGPLCERFGARKLMTLILIYGSICVALSSLVNSVAGLYTARFFISFVGGSFIMCQYWTTVMFAKEVVGTANATAGGWGNLGGGVSALLVGGLLEALGPSGAGYPDNVAWRYAMLVPAALMFMITIPMYTLSDDCPYGEWKNRDFDIVQPKVVVQDSSHDSSNNGTNDNTNQTGKEKEYTYQKSVSMTKVEGEANAVEKKKRYLPSGFDDWRVWILAIQYGLCFGVEVAITNVIPIYLYNGFKKDGCIENPKTPILECAYYNKSMAALVASLFGMTNIFARASGGLMSDVLFSKIGMRGRLLTLFVVNILQGIFVIIFSRMTNPETAVAFLVIFAMFVQMGAGATYGIVPFVNSKAIGPVSGIVGAGGNIGAVTWTAMFKAAPTMATGFLWLGIIVICGTFTLLPVPVKGVTLLCGGKEEMYDDENESTKIENESNNSTQKDSKAKNQSDHTSAPVDIDKEEGNNAQIASV